MAVLSFKFWQRHYRGDPAVVGKTIQLDHKTYTILGVMPVRFTWGDGEVFVPMKLASDQTPSVQYQDQVEARRQHGRRRGRIPAPLPGVRPANPKCLSQAIQDQRARSCRHVHPRSEEDDGPALWGRRAAARHRLRQCFDSAARAGHGATARVRYPLGCRSERLPYRAPAPHRISALIGDRSGAGHLGCLPGHWVPDPSPARPLLPV